MGRTSNFRQRLIDARLVLIRVHGYGAVSIHASAPTGCYSKNFSWYGRRSGSKVHALRSWQTSCQ